MHAAIDGIAMNDSMLLLVLFILVISARGRQGRVRRMSMRGSSNTLCIGSVFAILGSIGPWLTDPFRGGVFHSATDGAIISVATLTNSHALYALITASLIILLEWFRPRKVSAGSWTLLLVYAFLVLCVIGSALLDVQLVQTAATARYAPYYPVTSVYWGYYLVWAAPPIYLFGLFYRAAQIRDALPTVRIP